VDDNMEPDSDSSLDDIEARLAAAFESDLLAQQLDSGRRLERRASRGQRAAPTMASADTGDCGGVDSTSRSCSPIS
jgi:hypothetical protein